MEHSMSKGWFLLLATFMILLHTSPSESKSVSLLKHYFDGLNNVTAIADNMEFEFLFSSNIERMLADGGKSYVTPAALEAQEAVASCGRGKPYKTCLPRPNLEPKPDTCSTYKRGCPKPS
ncbi:hypothetical protein HRI_002227600 [Hibiscus trionum]|uniref:Uncharacterized protein n=1 Tax=Hibiscus trionum TaxID=183268 RepID=A0A9W7HZQ6_HIBTR|nr:hypothetical protein HRI_002227600 [Hibiscus trionum]